VNDSTGALLHVMAGVLRDAQGRVLLAQRPEGKHLAGFWEFPGGKREPGESPLHALARELHEELGIHIDVADGTPLIRVPWRYGERNLLLDAWQFLRWRNTPVSREGQAWRWEWPERVDVAALAPADRPIMQALRLPQSYIITPTDALPEQFDIWLARVTAAIEKGARLIQLRLPAWPAMQVREIAARLQPSVVEHGASMLLNGDIDGALELGSGMGVHLTSSQLMELDGRPLPWTQTIGASCHDASQLSHAAGIEADFATLSPVAPTNSHPGASTLGWEQFQRLAENAALPVYALGGMSPSMLDKARENGAQGVAGIGAFW
jgi:8-oxo-dGTP diphosphatase